MKRNPLVTLIAAASTVLAAVSVTGCALGKPDVPTVHVAGTERLYIRLMPFDSALTAELAGYGIDAAAMEDEVRAEIRYRLYLRGQEEARDSVEATVRVDAHVRHLRPGSGSAGTFVAFSLVSRRADVKPDSIAWTRHLLARENVPEPHTARHLSRLAAHELLARVQPPPKAYEPPPPLHLLR